MIVFSSISEHVDCVVVVFIFYFLIFRILEAIQCILCVRVCFLGRGCLRTAIALGITSCFAYALERLYLKLDLID